MADEAEVDRRDWLGFVQWVQSERRDEKERGLDPTTPAQWTRYWQRRAEGGCEFWRRQADTVLVALGLVPPGVDDGWIVDLRASWDGGRLGRED